MKGAKWPIFFKFKTGKTVHLFVSPEDKLQTVAYRVEGIAEVPQNSLSLIFRGKKLTGDVTVEQAGLYKEAIVHAILLNTSFDIFIKTLTGMGFSLHVSDSDQILEIKKKLYDKFAFPVSQQRIIYKGRQLDNDYATVREEGIVKEAQLMVILHLKKQAPKQEEPCVPSGFEEEECFDDDDAPTSLFGGEEEVPIFEPKRLKKKKKKKKIQKPKAMIGVVQATSFSSRLAAFLTLVYTIVLNSFMARYETLRSAAAFILEEFQVILILFGFHVALFSILFHDELDPFAILFGRFSLLTFFALFGVV
eukprot:CAMPEP_0201481618 /NCGR_PEP_ID=MMETSP0151_2-20130828/5891_1 /ASSEMBLY_ACC=CAM_ASM_000257 /TAXON_ID=200890 /ORGANISM="Paramoeba atlantica, Strain 621/1 / CCAP 1560/9" /LENGTH=305 /DNA_ID=CAMNT_0047863921 /DNA_START=12 /DNA_END=930 /DNA_ORIENTATION=+